MRSSLLVSLLLLVAAGGLAAQTAAAPAAQSPPPNAHPLRPGDILKVDVWGHPEFSSQFLVDEQGNLQYPVLGDIDARNLTVVELREHLRQGLETLFRSPFVTITPLFRMSVLGEVRSPGLYTVDPTLSVLDVIAMAGGPVPGGNMGKVRLMRGGTALQVSFSQGGSLQQMGVRSGDQIYVPRKSFTAQDLNMLLSVAQLALTITVLVVTVGK